MHKRARIFAYSAIATSLIFGSTFIYGCGDSGSTTPAFPASSTSTPSTDPTPNEPNDPSTPSTPTTPDNPNEPTPNPTPDQPVEEEGRQISLQFGKQSAAELANLKIVKARYLVAKDLDDGQGKLMEGSLNLDSEAKEMTIKDVPEEANTITCFYYNEEGKIAAVSSTRLKRNQAQTQSALGKMALGKLAKVETEEVETTIHSVEGAKWELVSDKTETTKDGYITFTLKLITADNTVIDDVIGLIEDGEIDLPQIAGEALMIRDPYRIGKFEVAQSTNGSNFSVKVTVKTAGGDVSNTSAAFAVNNNRYFWEFSYNPQDNTVMPPTTVSLKLLNMGHTYEISPYRNRLGFVGDFEFYPNSQNNYVFDYKTDPEKYAAANCLATAMLISDKLGPMLDNPIAAFAMIRPYELNETYMQIGSYYLEDNSVTNYNPWVGPYKGLLLSFPYATNENNQNIYAAASGEIVARGISSFILGELGGQFPCGNTHGTTIQNISGEMPCLEEAFKDILALYMSSQNIDVCRLAVSQCQGNWRKVNCLSSIGEEVGQYNKRDCLRQLINDEKWRDNLNVIVDPDTNNEYLTDSLIFSGAFYDIMTGIAQRNINAGMDSAIALKAAGQEAMELLIKGLYDANKDSDSRFDLGRRFVYRRAAIAMLKMDAKYNGCRAENIITGVMRSRNILFDGDNASTIIPRKDLEIY